MKAFFLRYLILLIVVKYACVNISSFKNSGGKEGARKHKAKSMLVYLII